MSANGPRFALGELCKLVRGTSPTMRTEPGSYPLVVTAAFRRTSADWQLEGPAVCVPLISSTGHGDAALHRVHYQEGKFALANLLVALLPQDHQRCDPKYLYHLLNTKKDELFVPLMLGTANVSLKEKDIVGVRVELPPVAEQRRIVARVDAIAAQVDEARRLRDEAATDCDSLLIALAHRADISEQQKQQRGWQWIRLGEVMRQSLSPVVVRTDLSYPNLGIYSFGRGLFEKPPIKGMTTSAGTLYQVRTGQFIYSRLFAFEGAYGRVPPSLDGRFVSNEYPTFDCDPVRLRSEFVEAYFRSKSVWADVAAGSKGLGDRRQRVQPDQILNHTLWLPPLAEQNRLVAIEEKAKALRSLQAEAATELDTLLPAVLARAFAGEL